MTNITSRSDAIERRLVDHITGEITVAASVIPRDEWDGLSDNLGPNRALGFGWALPYDPPERFIIPLCPELLAEAAVDMDDGELEDFLVAVMVLNSLFVFHVLDGVPHDEANRRADNEMLDKYPGSMEILSLAQLAVLDHRATGAG